MWWPRQKSDREQTFLTEEQLDQRRYNAQQYLDRKEVILKKDGPRPRKRAISVPAAATPSAPPQSQWPFISSKDDRPLNYGGTD